MESYDIVIVGAGPGGAVLASLLGERFRILLLERRSMIQPWTGRNFGKCCGGLLAPDAQKSLATLGIPLPESLIGGPQLFAVRSIDLKCDLERYYQRFYLNIDREAFDRYLVRRSLEHSNVTLLDEAEFLSWCDNTLTYRRRGQAGKITAKRLIAADGAASMVRRLYGAAPTPEEKYVAIQECYECKEILPYYGAFFDSDHTDFYGWTIPKHDGVLFGVALRPGREAQEHFEAMKAKVVQHGFEFGKCLRREGAWLLRPASRGVLWSGQGDIWAVGEAGGWISPSSAEGFSFAFESAKVAAGVLLNNPEATLAEYHRALASMRRRILGKRLKSPLMYQSLLRTLIMKSKITALKRFD